MKQHAALDAPFAYAAPMNGLSAAATAINDDHDDDDNDTSSPTSTIVPPSPAMSRRASLASEKLASLATGTPLPNPDAAADDETAEDTEEDTTTSSSSSRPSKLHPRVAVILGVDRKWYLPLVVCRALSVVPALWWGLRCAFTFLAELLRIRPGMWREGWVAIIVGSAAADWDVERRFRVTEVALAIMWCCASAYLSYFFMDCMMSRWLLNYSPPAVLIRLLATNGLFAYLTSSVLFLSGASSDPRLLLPAWISITTTLTFLYHATQNHAMIKRETTASLSVLSVASYISMSLLLLQMHLTRDNEPQVPAFVMGQRVLDWITSSATATATAVTAAAAAAATGTAV
ncbi:N-glycosylation protein EOS1 [Talaromyces islandicus]|uniref:N-glycosylation protein EOS1 n=1 Tax=Talaromyces islandicus TaxID=28573 RepID=A0A0U1LJ38_TALIS|nr:N-glycosylation protein EOS1 [Talaromyces islandicus]